jgi:hypothetical protein
MRTAETVDQRDKLNAAENRTKQDQERDADVDRDDVHRRATSPDVHLGIPDWPMS